MKIKKLKDFIVREYNKTPEYGLLILGAPGIGKSSQIRQAASCLASSLNLVLTSGYDVNVPKNAFLYSDIRLSCVEPTDLVGIPRSREGITFFEPPVWVVNHSKHPGIIFLDELTWIQRDDVWSVVPQIVLDKSIGGVKLHPQTLVVAAGNRPEDSSIVREIHSALLNRFKIIRVEAPTIEEWANYMDSKGEWDRRVLAFLKAFRNEPYFISVGGDGYYNYPTPRTWEWVARDLDDSDIDSITGLIGEEIGRKFVAFLKTNINIKELLEKPETFKDLNFDQKYMVPIALASQITNKNIDKVFRLVDSMCSVSSEFLVLLCMAMNRNSLVEFLYKLFEYNEKYKETLKKLMEIVDDLKGVVR